VTLYGFSKMVTLVDWPSVNGRSHKALSLMIGEAAILISKILPGEPKKLQAVFETPIETHSVLKTLRLGILWPRF
jgi:hypothetical protein